MTDTRSLEFLRTAQAKGLLPGSATLPEASAIQWPLVLMTSLVAWLATIPLVIVLVIITNAQCIRSPTGYILGTLMLATGLYLFNKENLSVFMEQFILAGLVLVGIVLIGFSLRDDFSNADSWLMMAPVTLTASWRMARRWLQCAFATLACFFLMQGLAGSGDAAVAALFAWIVFFTMLLFAQPRNYARIDAIAAGWGAALLVGLTLGGGSASFFTSSIGSIERLFWGSAHAISPEWSALLTLAAAGWAVIGWETLKRRRYIPVAVIAVGLAWYMPSLGGIFVVLSVCATSGRHVLAGAAALAAVMTLSHFYYYLAVPLTIKGLIVTAAASVLAAVAWIHHPPKVRAVINISRGTRSVGILVGMLIVLVGINASIWQKEQLISTGTPVLVELAPADPRSLMQGDFMRLGFRLPDSSSLENRTDKVIGHRDERGVTQLTRFDNGSALRPGELKIDLIRKNGSLTLVTDAWYFAEGEAKRWEAAKYGEFRVDSSGKALLVGLRDDKLRSIR